MNFLKFFNTYKGKRLLSRFMSFYCTTVAIGFIAISVQRNDIEWNHEFILAIGGFSLAMVALGIDFSNRFEDYKQANENSILLNDLLEQTKGIYEHLHTLPTNEIVEQQKKEIELLRQEIANQKAPKFSLITNNFIKKEDQ